MYLYNLVHILHVKYIYSSNKRPLKKTPANLSPSQESCFHGTPQALTFGGLLGLPPTDHTFLCGQVSREWWIENQWGLPKSWLQLKCLSIGAAVSPWRNIMDCTGMTHVRSISQSVPFHSSRLGHCAGTRNCLRKTWRLSCHRRALWHAITAQKFRICRHEQNITEWIAT